MAEGLVTDIIDLESTVSFTRSVLPLSPSEATERTPRPDIITGDGNLDSN